MQGKKKKGRSAEKAELRVEEKKKFGEVTGGVNVSLASCAANFTLRRLRPSRVNVSFSNHPALLSCV